MCGLHVLLGGEGGGVFGVLTQLQPEPGSQGCSPTVGDSTFDFGVRCANSALVVVNTSRIREYLPSGRRSCVFSNERQTRGRHIHVTVGCLALTRDVALPRWSWVCASPPYRRQLEYIACIVLLRASGREPAPAPAPARLALLWASEQTLRRYGVPLTDN